MKRFGQRTLHYFDPFRLYVIADIHAQWKRLESLLKKVMAEFEVGLDHLVFSGDLFDSPLASADSYAVWMTLLELQAKVPNVFFVEGNHEEMLTDWLRRGYWGIWQQHNAHGRFTVMELCKGLGISHGLDVTKDDDLRKQVKLKLEETGMVKLIDSLIPYYESEDVIVTHAPIDRPIFQMFGGLNEYDDDDSAYYGRVSGILERMSYEIKWGYTVENKAHCIPEMGKTLVCGHQYAHHKHPRLFADRVFLDTGCGKRESSPLSCIVLPEKRVIQSD